MAICISTVYPSAYELFAAIDPSEPDLTSFPEGALDGEEDHKEGRRRKQIEERNIHLSYSKKMAKHFKDAFSRKVKVHFVGAW